MSGNEPIRLDFGKKLGQVELKKDGGIQQSAFDKNEVALSIFKHYNKDKNVVLDEGELQKLYSDLEQAAGKDKKLTAGEAVRFLKSMGIKNVKANEAQGVIKSFIDFIGSEKDMVEKTAMSQGHVNVTYKDGKEEFYMYDRDNKKSTLRLLKFSDDEGNHEVTFENDGKTKASEEIRTDYAIKNIEYKNGKFIKEVTLMAYSPEDASSIGAKFVPPETAGTRITEDTSSYKQEFLNDKLEILTTFESSVGSNTIIQKDAEGNETARLEMDENGEWKQTVTDNKTGAKTVIDGDKETTQFTETRTMEKTGDGVKLKDGGKEVALKYDEAGHVIAYAKEGENFKATAKRLGIDVNNEREYKAFCDLNAQAVKRSHGGWFKIGEEVKLPTGFEAKLNVGEYEVDVKAEADKWKEKVKPKVNPDELNVDHGVFTKTYRDEVVEINEARAKALEIKDDITRLNEIDNYSLTTYESRPYLVKDLNLQALDDNDLNDVLRMMNNFVYSSEKLSPANNSREAKIETINALVKKAIERDDERIAEVTKLIKDDTLGKKYDEAIATLMEFANTKEKLDIKKGTKYNNDGTVDYTYKFAKLANGKYLHIINFGTGNSISFEFSPENIQKNKLEIEISSDGGIHFNTNLNNHDYEYSIYPNDVNIPYEKLYNIAKSILGEPDPISQ